MARIGNTPERISVERPNAALRSPRSIPVAAPAVGIQSKVLPRLLSTRDASVYLGRTEKAIRRMIEKDQLPIIREGRRIHLDRAVLDRRIEASAQMNPRNRA